MAHIIEACDKQYTVGIEDMQKEIYEIIEENMGTEFAQYVNEYIKELKEKSDKAYWSSQSDEQVYEEELNEMSELLDNLYDYFEEIKSIASNKYIRMPEWGDIAIDGMKLIERNR